MNKKVFVGGPISHLMRENGFDEEFVKIHSWVINELSRLGYQVLSAHVVEQYGKNKVDPDKAIVNRDLHWIDEADACIFLFPSKDCQSVRTDGTYIELGYATSKCSHVWCFWDSANAHVYSPMFRGMTSRDINLCDFSMIKEVLKKLE